MPSGQEGQNTEYLVSQANYLATSSKSQFTCMLKIAMSTH